MPPQIYSAFIRCNTLYLAMQGVCHPFPLDSLKGCVGAEQSRSIASASLQPYGSFRHKHTRSLSLICRIEVDNILTVGSNVSLATDKCIRCYRLRYLLSLVGGYVFVGAVIIYLTILPVWSFCPRGANTPSLFVAYFFRKNSNRI